MQRLVVILHSGSLSAERADELDTLTQVREITAELQALDWQVEILSYELGEMCVITALQALEPAVVFNLVESVFGSDEQSYRATQLLDQLGLPYTGSRTHAIRRSNNKPRVKKLLLEAGIPTPAWVSLDAVASPHLPVGRYIVKSETEHGSLGLDNASVVDSADVWFAITHMTNRHGGTWFAEQFVDGREFNVSLLVDGEGDAAVLPIAEIDFTGLPTTMPRIVDYAAKWDEASLSYRRSNRIFPPAEPPLFDHLANIALRCWDICDLSGYARIDFRVDSDNTPYVIDINANPCLSADAGFLASAAQAGMESSSVIQRIMQDALHHHPRKRHTRSVMG